MNKVTKYFDDLTKCINEVGWKVRLAKIKKLAGQCRMSTKTITVSPEYKNTLVGCYILGHEAGHMVDYMDGKYPKFYRSKDGKCNDKKLIEKVEWSATSFSKQLMEARGFSLENIPQTKRSWLKKELNFWLIMYGSPVKAVAEKKKKKNEKCHIQKN